MLHNLKWVIWLVKSKLLPFNKLGRVKQICVFEHSVLTNFNCAYPAIQRGQGSGFLSEAGLQKFWNPNRSARPMTSSTSYEHEFDSPK